MRSHRSIVSLALGLVALVALSLPVVAARVHDQAALVNNSSVWADGCDMVIRPKSTSPVTLGLDIQFTPTTDTLQLILTASKNIQIGSGSWGTETFAIHTGKFRVFTIQGYGHDEKLVDISMENSNTHEKYMPLTSARRTEAMFQPLVFGLTDFAAKKTKLYIQKDGSIDGFIVENLDPTLVVASESSTHDDFAADRSRSSRRSPAPDTWRTSDPYGRNTAGDDLKRNARSSRPPARKSKHRSL